MKGLCTKGQDPNVRIKKYKEIMPPELCEDRIMKFLVEQGFFFAPASAKYHGSYVGGLFDHSFNVTYALSSLTDELYLKWSRPISPFIIGMFHDLCKMDNYVLIFEEETKDMKSGGAEIRRFVDHFQYNHELYLTGHGDKSVMLASQILSLTDEEVMCIRYHMGAFTDKEEWSNYTRAVHKYSNVLFTHTADMIAAHVWEVE